MGDSLGWIVPVVLAGLCVLSALWTLATAPGFNVRGKHVLLSGATKGLGLAVAKRYAAAGARLSLVARSMERLESAMAEIQKHAANGSTEQDTSTSSSSIFVAECDISDPDAVARAIEQANAFHERPTDHVVHAAVVLKRGYAWEQDSAQLKRDIGATYLGAVHLFKYALPAMIEGNVRGRFVIVSSAEALATSSGSSSFSGSLFALRGLADSLRNELLLYGISMSIYFPGRVQGNPIRTNAPKPAFAVDAPPQTPVEGKETHGTSYCTFPDELTASPADYDADAKSLVDGLKAGYYSITNSWSGHLMRMLSNGTSPRKNNGVEWICIFFVAGYHAIESFLYLRQARAAVANAASASSPSPPQVVATGAAM